jgi:hypothetical protein
MTRRLLGWFLAFLAATLIGLVYLLVVLVLAPAFLFSAIFGPDVFEGPPGLGVLMLFVSFPVGIIALGGIIALTIVFANLIERRRLTTRSS